METRSQRNRRNNRSNISVVFPSSLESSKMSYPSIIFEIEKPKVSDAPPLKASGTPDRIQLYIPQGISFGDTMSYNSTDLGSIGQAALNGSDKLLASARKGAASLGKDLISGTIATIKGAAKASFSDDKKSQTARSLAIAKTAASLVPGSGDVADLLVKAVANPNTNVKFQSTNIRSFSFSFKLVPSSEKESNAAKSIVEFFRYNAYPSGNIIALSYPPTYFITFMDGGNENNHIPKIAESYLISVSTVYNESTNAFHMGGAPVETTISLNFQETKALLRDDIMDISLNSPKRNINNGKNIR